MADIDLLMEELVTANRILAHEGVVDGFGHVTLRHPQRPDRYVMSRARAPECVEVEDLMEFTLDGTPTEPKGRKPYLERFIHGAIYEARPEIISVVHNHSPSTIPFGITSKKLRPLMHMCATIGHEVPVWDINDNFGDTDLLVSNMAMGRDLAKTLGNRPTALMRGHGCVVAAETLRKAVWISIYLELNANLQMQAMAMGDVKYLSSGEVDAVIARTSGFTVDRGWEYWCRRAGRPARALEINPSYETIRKGVDLMGRVVTFAQLPPETSGDGVSMAAITRDDVREMDAAFVRVAAGKRWGDSVPDGSDCYLFALSGSGAIAAGGARDRLSPQAFATIAERQAFAIDSDGMAVLDLVRVLAPPPNGGCRLAGFDQQLRVAERGKTPIVDIPSEKKRRVYFVGHGAAQSARAHAMIVIYAKDTVTGLHHHPNAESMFVPLDGALAFTVNGAQVEVTPGQAAYFAMNDSHGLRVAAGHTGASFLEFHIPAAFTTVRE